MNKTNKMSKLDFYTLPIVPVLETWDRWRAYIGREADPTISFELEKVVADESGVWSVEKRVKEPFAMREQFFAIAGGEDALGFFQEYGPLNVQARLDNKAPAVKLSAVMERKNFYLDALLSRSLDNLNRTYSGDDLREGMQNLYLWQNLPMELAFRQPMQSFVRCKDVEDALRATVFLDRLRALPWQRCAREDCGKPFAVTSKRPKLYCTPECAHLQSVRSYNKRQQKAKAAKSKQVKGKR
jgi:hypothetical protein